MNQQSSSGFAYLRNCLSSLESLGLEFTNLKVLKKIFFGCLGDKEIIDMFNTVIFAVVYMFLSFVYIYRAYCSTEAIPYYELHVDNYDG